MARHQKSIRVYCWTRGVSFALTGALLALSPSTAAAQSDASIKDLLRRLYTAQPTPIEINTGQAGQVVENLRRFPDEVAKLVGLGVFNLPSGSSSAGFTYTVDPKTGESLLKSDSFGPLFAERPLTNGKGVWNLAFSYQRTSFDQLNGIEMADQGTNERTAGLFIFDNGGQFPGGYQQYFTERAFFSVKSNTLSLAATFGLGSRVDVGVAVPVSFVEATGRRQQFYDFTIVYPIDEGTRREFPNGPIGSRDSIAPTTIDASGVGDLALRAKVALVQNAGQAVGVSAEVRLPTGDEEDLLGAGKTSTRLQLLASKTAGPASFYANGGYTAGGQSDEVNYTAGVDVVIGGAKQLTLAGSVIGQTLRDGVTFDTFRTFNFLNPANGIRTTFDRQILVDESLNVINAAVGAKYHLTGRWLLSAAVLFPLNSDGFRGGVTPIIGLDHTWTPTSK
jgi:hypothetical protein